MIPLPYKLLVGALIALGLLGTGWHLRGKVDEAKSVKKHSEEVEATLTVERETRKVFDSITLDRRKERENEQDKMDKLQFDIRSGTVKLRLAASGCEVRKTSAGIIETRAELSPASSEFIIGIAGEGDSAIMDLNECINKYNALP